MASTAARSPLFPPIEPYRTGTMAVDKIHTIYFEECGNPNGKPVVFLHGGPGGGVQPEYRRYFDPATWRVVLFDQRACGRSTPHAELRNNTTWHLVADMEALRCHLNIDRWAVMGGSWGSTLALAYAETHPGRCTEIILRSIFMLRHQEIQWFYQEGASFIFPDFWEDYLAPIPVEERGDLVGAYYRRLTSDNAAVRREAAIAWSGWEGRTSKLYPSKGLESKMSDPEFAAAFARIECHYFINGGFMETDHWLLDNVSRIRSIPGAIVQGRYDVVCPMVTAWELHQKWPEAAFYLIDDAGHSMSEPGITAKLVDVIKGFGHRHE